MNDIVKIGDATLYHGDCLEILPTLPKVDAVVTDPPYGIANWSDSGGGQKSITAEEAEDMRRWDDAVPVVQVMAAWGLTECAIFWGGNYLADLLGKCTAPLIWDKTTRGMHLSEAELAWTKGTGGTCRVFTRIPAQKYRQHPTQKPIELMNWCVEKTHGTILDPFMGSGTTGVACANLGRKFIGVEIERKYFDIACKRISAAYAQGRLFA